MLFFFIAFCLSFHATADDLEVISVQSDFETTSLVDFVPSVTTLRTEELKKRREISLGDTLRNEAGVTSSGFGPNAGRPIIRGLDGDRIRVLQNGLGVMDASSQSVDHAVPVDTMIIDSIEIVRGPMSLLYGSSAVGGVVNVTTNRVHTRFEEGLLQEIQIQGDSAFDSVNSGARVDYGKNNWMLHFDGSYRNANNQKIPGKALSRKFRQVNPGADADEENELPNSGSVQKTASIGVSKIFSEGYLGISTYHFDNFYGTVANENVDIKMRQDRIELHGEYLFKGALLKKIRLRSAQSDYTHKEIESGEVGTTFANEGNESRLEFFTELGNLKGTSGFQTQFFNFSAVGDEAFLPPSKNRLLSLFTLHELTNNKNTYLAGARLEDAYIANESSGGKTRSYNGYNGSIGFKRILTDSFSSSLNLSYTERIPTSQELFADGSTEHVATGIFEQGNDELRKEKAYAVDLGLQFKTDNREASLNFYTQHFQDYIALVNSDASSVNYDYTSVDAIFYGVDFDSRLSLGKSPWSLLGKADAVRAKNKDTGHNLPRISPARLSLGVEHSQNRWSSDLEVQYNFEQTKTAPNELRTDSFILVNAGLRYELNDEEKRLSLFGRLKNILDQEARLHSSTLKDRAPLPGRSVVAGAQFLF